MPDQVLEPELVGPSEVDPDETQFRADTLLMHAELVELELYKIRRELFSDPGLVKLNIGAGNPAEQTVRGFQGDAYNGVVIYNPTPATLSVGFQAGAGVLAPATVPPFSFVTFPERYVNLSIALTNPADQAQTIALPVTVLRTKITPAPASGPFTSPQPVTSLTNASALAGGAALDNGAPRANHSLIVVTSAGVTAGQVQLAGSHDGVNYALIGTAISTTAGGVVGTTTATGPYRYVRAQITTALTGGTVTATVASS